MAGESEAAGGKIVIAGAMGAGKTTVGHALAGRLGWPLRDSDVDIEQRTGRKGARIATEEGVAALHELEAKVLLEQLATPGPAVVSAAGSTVESPPCRLAMAKAFVVWLDLPEDVLNERRRHGSHRRSVDAAEAHALLERRRGWLMQLADLHIDEVLPPERVVNVIEAALPQRRV